MKHRPAESVSTGASRPARRRGWLFGILLLTVAAYSNTFQVEFVFDDLFNLVENPLIRELQPFFDRGTAGTAGAAPGQLYGLRTRWFAFLTFALNYRLHGLDVAGYHAVNLAIHLLAGALLWRLVDRSLALPPFQASELSRRRHVVALLGAALFLVHPIQTQAVTYVVQRMASLTAMLCLLSLVTYVEARIGRRPFHRWGCYGVSLVALVAAMHSKENAASFPLVLLLYELLFLSGSRFKRWLGLLPHLATMAIVPWRLVSLRSLDSLGVDTVSALQHSESATPPLVYLATQLRVVVTYLRLLFWPAGQNLDYDNPLRQSLSEPAVLASLTLLAGLFGLSLCMIWQSRRREAAWRWIGFGILWFFVTLSVESSVIPIADVLVEHRLYLPSMGWIAAFVGVAVLHWPRRALGVGATLGIAVVLLLSVATFRRNSVWSDPLRLWSDTAEKSPNKSRPLNSVGAALELQGERQRALEYYQRAVASDSNNFEATVNLGRLLLQTGDAQRAAEVLLDALALAPGSEIARSLLLDAAARSRRSLGDSMPSGESTIRETHARAEELRAAGRPREAMTAYERLLITAAGDSSVWNGLGGLYLDQGMTAFALTSFTTAVRLAPDDGASFANLGLALKRAGRLQEAEAALRRAVALEPAHLPALNNLGNLMLAAGRLEEAHALFQTAIELDPQNLVVRRNLELVTRALSAPAASPSP